jgi:hypothetical protein
VTGAPARPIGTVSPGDPVVVATDVDRTLVFSPRATAALGGARPRHVVETCNSEVISELADEVAHTLARLGRMPATAVTVVPTTTRTVSQLTRIRLPLRVRFAIACCGGVVLEDGRPDPLWSQLIAQRLAECAAPPDVRPVLDRLVAQGEALRAYTAEDQFCYAIVDPARFRTEHVAQLVTDVAPHAWRVAAQGRKVYVLPRSLHKGHAVSYVLDRLTAELGRSPRLLAAGDSWLDAEMIELADRAWVPAGSEIAQGGRLPWNHAQITAEPGHAAAAEIVTAWARLAGMPHVA